MNVQVFQSGDKGNNSRRWLASDPRSGTTLRVGHHLPIPPSPISGRVHPALPDARSAEGLSAHPPLWVPRQLLPRAKAGSATAAKGTSDYRQRYEALTGRSLTQCPICQQGEMSSLRCCTVRDWVARRTRSASPVCRSSAETSPLHDTGASGNGSASAPSHELANPCGQPCRLL